MKSIMVTVVLLLCAHCTFSQHSISGSFNATTPGLYYTISPEYTWGHHRLSAGLNINQGYSPGHPEVTTWDLKPHDMSEAFGVNLNYNYVFYPNYSAIQPYVFFDLNYQYCGSRRGISVAEGQLVTFGYKGPFDTFTETIGIGFTTDIYKTLFFNIKGGAGLTHKNTTDHFRPYLDGATYKLGVGLGYRFGEWNS